MVCGMSNPPTGDKRSVSTDALATLGTILNHGEKRDAIHLAVEPVVAGQFMHPGDHINVVNGIATRCEEGKGLGIVDPFIIGNVKEGQRFWFVMYPRQVTSLRHVWAHPAFPDEVGMLAPVAIPAETRDERVTAYAMNYRALENAKAIQAVLRKASGVSANDADPCPMTCL